MLYPPETNRSPEKLIYFLHIPKTGGTTLRDIISRQYKRENIFTVPSLKESNAALNDLAFEEKKQLEIVQGHLKFGIHEATDRPSQYFTILRDPIKRVISSYNYILQVKNHPFDQSTTEKVMTIQELYESGVNPLLINGQTQLVSGVTGKNNDPLIKSEDILQKAKNNIADFFITVGLLEEFDASLLIMQKMLGWKTPYYSIANRSKPEHTIAISDETIAFLTEQNELDIKLYQFVSDRFHTLKESFTNDLGSFKMKNRLLNPVFTYNRIQRLIKSKMK